MLSLSLKQVESQNFVLSAFFFMDVHQVVVQLVIHLLELHQAELCDLSDIGCLIRLIWDIL